MSARPDVTLKFVTEKNGSKVYYEVGAGWISRFGVINFKFVEEDKDDEKYPKMAFAKALKLTNDKKGFINCFANGGKGSRVSVTGGANEEF